MVEVWEGDAGGEVKFHCVGGRLRLADGMKI